MMKRMLMAVAATLAAVVSNAATYYASPNGKGSGAQGDPCSLMDAVAKVNADQGGEIVLATGTYQEDASSAGVTKWVYNNNTASYYVLGQSGANYPITVRSASGNPEDVTIKGQYCDNGKSIRLFLVYGNAVRLSGVTLCEAAADLGTHGGGAVLGATDEAVGSVVDNCILERNKAAIGSAVRAISVVNSVLRGNEVGGWDTGGAIYGGGDISNCTFIANYTISDRGSSSCVYGNGCNLVVDCSFQCNTNAGWTGYCGAVGNVTNLLRCVFSGNCNSANTATGATCLRSTSYITDCKFIDQKPEYGFAVGSGGRFSGCKFLRMTGKGYALNAPVSVSNCTFEGWVGECSVIGGTANLVVSDSCFSLCSNRNSSASFPAGCIDLAARVERCGFTDTYAMTKGGALANASYVVDCGFTNNFATSNGAAGTLCENVIGCKVLGGETSTGIFYQPGIVSNCTFTACKVTARTSGTVYGKEGTRICDSAFVCCTNNGYVAGGAAVENVAVLDGCTVTGCYSYYFPPVRNFKAAANSIFTNNFSWGAGVISGAEGSVMTNCLVAYNHASNSYLDKGVVVGISNIVNCTIVSNTLANKVAVSGGTVYNSLIIDNSPSDMKDATLVSSWWSLPNGYASVDANCRQAVYADIKFRGENDKGLPPFALKPKSPARGAGQTLSGQSDQLDLAGHPRVAEGQNVDLGAYAYFPAPFGLMLMLK